MMACADYVRFLIEEIRRLIQRGVSEACIAIDVPVDAATKIFEASEGARQLIGWQHHGVVDIYLWHDPGQPHEVLTLQLMSSIKQAASAFVGGTFLESLLP